MMTLMQAMAPQSVMFPGLHPAAMMATVSLYTTFPTTQSPHIKPLLWRHISKLHFEIRAIRGRQFKWVFPYRSGLAPPTLLGATQIIAPPALAAPQPFQGPPEALVSPQDPQPNRHLRFSWVDKLMNGLKIGTRAIKELF